VLTTPATTTAPNARVVPTTGFVIAANGVNHAYEGQNGWVQALQNFDIAIPRNEFLCLLGPSGCGKSSFLRIVTGLMKPIEGEVLLNGKRIEEPGLDRGIVFQEPALFPWLTALRNVAFGLEMGGMDKRSVNERAAQVLRIVGLERAMDLYPYQLSGGMKHRVAVARAWALPDASVLLMDEPFSAIDAINRMTLQKYLVDAWLAEPRTVIYVTHDIDEAVYLADRIAIMTPSPGRVGQYVTVDLPRPRDRNATKVTELRGELTEIMRRLGGDTVSEVRTASGLMVRSAALGSASRTMQAEPGPSFETPREERGSSGRGPSG
jgi:NitT/TauT family transport system ATP-binding protein